MAALQTVAFGAASDGSQGDSVRTGFTKDNSNVAVLQKQATLTSFASTITAAQALTVSHVGQRVNINLATAGTVNLPSAATCAADNVLLLRNVGTTVVTLAITSGSGDTVALSKLNPGESALMDTDGVHAWNILMRGRSNSDNEIVNGNCTVNGNEIVLGSLTLGSAGQASVSAAGAYSGPSAAYAGNVTVGGTLGVTGQATFTVRPTFASKVPWDSGNLSSPATLDTTQTFAGAKTFSSVITVQRSGGTGYNTGHFYAVGNNSDASIGFFANAGGSYPSSGAFRFFGNASGFGFSLVNGDNSAYAPLTVSTLSQSSDELLKADVDTLQGVLPNLRKLRGVSYTLKADGTRNLGLIAQEVREVYPELVETLEMDIDADGDAIAHQYDEAGNEIYGPNGKPESRKALGVKYQNMTAPLLQGLLELDAAMQSALARIAALESKAAA